MTTRASLPLVENSRIYGAMGGCAGFAGGGVGLGRLWVAQGGLFHPCSRDVTTLNSIVEIVLGLMRNDSVAFVQCCS